MVQLSVCVCVGVQGHGGAEAVGPVMDKRGARAPRANEEPAAAGLRPRAPCPPPYPTNLYYHIFRHQFNTSI